MAPRILATGLVLLLGVSFGQSALGQERRRQPAKPPEVAPAAQAQVRVFSLRDLDAAEMVQTLKDVFAGDEGKKIRIALHRSTNSIIAVGGESELETIEAIIARLEVVAAEKSPKDKKKQAEELKEQVALAESNVEQSRERAAWAERMVKLGYMSAAQAAAERSRLTSAQEKLTQARQKLKELQGGPDKPKIKP
jgi:type II secretory pathway component GspD/PulD (secretin)